MTRKEMVIEAYDQEHAKEMFAVKRNSQFGRDYDLLNADGHVVGYVWKTDRTVYGGREAFWMAFRSPNRRAALTDGEPLANDRTKAGLLRKLNS